jgi:hypothetical protein
MTHAVNVLYQRPYTLALRLLLSNSGVPMSAESAVPTRRMFL